MLAGGLKKGGVEVGAKRGLKPGGTRATKTGMIKPTVLNKPASTLEGKLKHVGLDVHKETIVVGVAEEGLGEARYQRQLPSKPTSPASSALLPEKTKRMKKRNATRLPTLDKHSHINIRGQRSITAREDSMGRASRVNTIPGNTITKIWCCRGFAGPHGSAYFLYSMEHSILDSFAGFGV